MGLDVRFTVRDVGGVGLMVEGVTVTWNGQGFYGSVQGVYSSIFLHHVLYTHKNIWAFQPPNTI